MSDSDMHISFFYYVCERVRETEGWPPVKQTQKQSRGRRKEAMHVRACVLVVVVKARLKVLPVHCVGVGSPPY